MKHNTKNYDYLIVGTGPYGSIFAYEAAKRGKRVLMIDKRDHIGGNMYTRKEQGINVHEYGAHIFHTDNKEVWDYINQFTEFNNYINQVVADYKGERYNLPFNMNTFYQMWGTKTPEEAAAKIAEQREAAGVIAHPKNLEEQAISLIGTDIYEKLIKGYTEKQWGRSLHFEHEIHDSNNVQGNAVINYTDAETPYTRVMEWRHFDQNSDEGKSVITKEYPQNWDKTKEAYYPVNDHKNSEIFKLYRKEADKIADKVKFGGRLGNYQYYDMDMVFHAALVDVAKEFKNFDAS
ncbi:UDP-galactopyranose mutase [Lactococcus ileimucosae]|uniref:UDP-galactopyranose mutase n=1 Tax=Lactococcus ileimucosae TaxID=2941329 RepID=A0ABV4D8V0_9LACT